MSIDSFAVQLAESRKHLPELASAMTALVIDNPGTMLLLISGEYVILHALVNAVRPRSPLGVIACGVVAWGISTAAAAKLVEAGIIRLKVRED